jgi:hypothetical protein
MEPDSVGTDDGDELYAHSLVACYAVVTMAFSNYDSPPNHSHHQ